MSFITQNASPIRPRKPVVAAILSFTLPGFGQLYNGELNKAIWLFLSFSFLIAPALIFVVLHLSPDLMLPALVIGLIATLSLWLYGIIQAWRSANRLTSYTPQAWQTSGIYVAVWIVGGVILLPALTHYVRNNFVESFIVPSGSMEPNVLTGDMLFADKRYNRPRFKEAVKRGDIAIFVFPNDRTNYFIKRIIGLPGDHLQIRGSTVWINGKPLTVLEQKRNNLIEVTETNGQSSWHVVWQPSNIQSLPQTDMQIPSGYVFMMGDNRSASNDSRFFGLVPLPDVIGKARQVWFSYLPKSSIIRWQRMGLVLH